MQAALWCWGWLAPAATAPSVRWQVAAHLRRPYVLATYAAEIDARYA
jgi:hypothetical protein